MPEKRDIQFSTLEKTYILFLFVRTTGWVEWATQTPSTRYKLSLGMDGTGLVLVPK